MAKSTYEYPSDISFEAAASEVLLSGFRKMAANIELTRSGLERSVATPEEIEALHDMRVGSRRLRAGLEVFGKLFAKRDFRRLDQEIGAVTDALGAVRDLDVQIDSLRSLALRLPPNEAFGIESLIEHQTEQRRRKGRALFGELDRWQKSGFRRRVKSLIKQAVADTTSAGPHGRTRNAGS